MDRLVDKTEPIGTAGFEPATPATPLQCATGLRYVPDISRSVIVSLPLRRRNPRGGHRPMTCHINLVGPTGWVQGTAIRDMVPHGAAPSRNPRELV
jgi:hypothetical protein